MSRLKPPIWLNWKVAAKQPEWTYAHLSSMPQILPSSNMRFSKSYWDLFWATARFKISVINRFLLMLNAGKMSLHQQSRCSGSSDLQLDHKPSYALKSKAGLPFYRHHCFAKFCATKSVLIWYNLKGGTEPLIIHSLQI